MLKKIFCFLTFFVCCHISSDNKAKLLSLLKLYSSYCESAKIIDVSYEIEDLCKIQDRRIQSMQPHNYDSFIKSLETAIIASSDDPRIETLICLKDFLKKHKKDLLSGSLRS